LSSFLLVAGERPLDQQVIRHVADLDLEDADRAADLRVVVRIDHLFLLGQRSTASAPAGRRLPADSGDASRSRRKAIIMSALMASSAVPSATPNFIDVLGQTDVGGPARQILAGGNVENPHPRSGGHPPEWRRA